jgi:hypothetical protein
VHIFGNVYPVKEKEPSSRPDFSGMTLTLDRVSKSGTLLRMNRRYVESKGLDETDVDESDSVLDFLALLFS